ncbi:MAG: AAA family ATPase [Acidobacteriota bacterium]
MTRRANHNGAETPRTNEGISRISVCGYKSISTPTEIEIRRLTILAGANSSGKSSVMQPLLLLKQTLEATYDPGPLLLDGPNVRFSSAEQLFSRTGKGAQADSFWVGIEVEKDRNLRVYFGRQRNGGIRLEQMTYGSEKHKNVLRPEKMTQAQITALLSATYRDFAVNSVRKREWVVVRNRCFLELKLNIGEDDPRYAVFIGSSPSEGMETYVREVIHLPGLRGNPARTYPVTAVGPTFPGTFENYAASVISRWYAEKKGDKLRKLAKHLERLGLTWKVAARAINDTQVELQVGRLPHAIRGGARDLVNIADVGFGMSQTLPVLVALLAAQPGQLVYLEQPEIHLHPRAQFLMAEILADAAIRGVRVVAETHSSLLLLGVQTLVAEASRKLDPDMVKLHWFTRRADGSTQISSNDLDASGAFGDWPEDFGEVFLEAESRYLDAGDMKSTKN